ncbi:MAG: L-lactate dehydrogenase [Clostridia bacterium]|nr:L-lactate dehydrogenase [Clostridia bacterium]
MKKITIIGSGRVGSTIAYSLTLQDIASEVVVIDIDEGRALGEALDIRQGMPYDSTCFVYAGNYNDAKGSDIVVITSGIARKPGQSRLELINTNINIQKSIIPQITKYAPEAVYIMVSNPVDVLTYAFCKLSGIPENRVIGTGTILDTSRLRARLAEYCGVDPKNINAYVFGEHGDSSFIPWSIANVAQVPIEEFNRMSCIENRMTMPLNKDDVEKYIRGSGSKIIARKGATFYAISSNVCHICKAVLCGTNSTMAVSTMMHGEYGIDDVCLSILRIVGHGGICGKVTPTLTEEEHVKLRYSADVLKGIISNLEL